jgi:hypothetical protein
LVVARTLLGITKAIGGLQSATVSRGEEGTVPAAKSPLAANDEEDEEDEEEDEVVGMKVMLTHAPPAHLQSGH